VRRLRDLIEKHINEEETEIFPQLRNSVDRKKLPMIGGQIRREEALIL
jgi:hemerythrin-like domain-containing protein